MATPAAAAAPACNPKTMPTPVMTIPASTSDQTTAMGVCRMTAGSTQPITDPIAAEPNVSMGWPSSAR